MEYTIENFGLTKSPLDAWRGSGKHSKPILSKPIRVPKVVKCDLGDTIPLVPNTLTLFIPESLKPDHSFSR